MKITRNNILLFLNFFKSVSKDAIRDGFITSPALLTKLSSFTPNSAGNSRQLAHLTLLSAQQTIPLINQLLSVIEPSRIPIEIVDIETFRDSEKNTVTNKLKKLFEQHGSDKSIQHDYHLLYGNIISNFSSLNIKVLEIGMGSNDEGIVSHMGIRGCPGASLRAFRDLSENITVFGADIDKSILFTEERIKTFFLDQTDPNSFEIFAQQIGQQQFDLIIDDGLHSPNANIASMIFALPRLKSSGYFVVEDISAESLEVWYLVSSLLPTRFSSALIKAKGGYLFTVQAP